MSGVPLKIQEFCLDLWQKAATLPVSEKEKQKDQPPQRWRRQKPQGRVVRAVGFKLQCVTELSKRLGKMQVSLLSARDGVRGPANLLLPRVPTVANTAVSGLSP